MLQGWARHQIGSFELDINWEIDSGGVLVLFGRSGAGKTMTLRVIAGLLQPNAGRVQLGARVLYSTVDTISIAPHMRRVAYVSQGNSLFPHLSVRSNVEYGFKSTIGDDKDLFITDLVEKFQLTELQGRKIWELSGGEQQRVSLARAFASRPAALLLDEPFSSLDDDLRESMRNELRSILRESEIPVILVTHDHEDAIKMGDVVQIVENGNSSIRGDPESILGWSRVGGLPELMRADNVLTVVVNKLEPAIGTMVAVAGEVELILPFVESVSGDKMLFGISSKDVVIAAEKPQKVGAENILEGQIEHINFHGTGYDIVIDCGIQIVSYLSQTAFKNMELAISSRVWVISKASSWEVVEGRS